MSLHSQTAVISRCPICYNGGIDVYLVNDAAAGSYRCLKCSFTGTAAEVLKMYDAFKKRYRLSGTRVTLEDQRKL